MSARLETVTSVRISLQVCRLCGHLRQLTPAGEGTRHLTTALRRGEEATSRNTATASRELSAAAALQAVLTSLEDSKAEDLISIDLTGKSALADAMVIASGRSNRHVAAIAERLVTDLKQAGGKDLRVEGLQSADWVLVDTGDVIVHLFRPEVRTFYNLEKMWRNEESAAEA